MRVDVLDHGYVELIRVDGTDEFLAQTARTSTESTGDVVKDAKLVTRLIKDRHTSPIEFGGVVLEIAMPIFVARQWMRHRTGAFNEFSMRYSEAPDVFYVPEPDRCQAQSTFNKQGSAEELEKSSAEEIRRKITKHSENSYKEYRNLLDLGLTRELARVVLPVNFYTKVRWKIDLHNLMHFLVLREDPHAQYEIRVYANAIHEILKKHFPIAMLAFENHIQNKAVISSSLANLICESDLGNMDNALRKELEELSRRFS